LREFIEEKIKKLIADLLGIKQGKITLESRFIEDLKADSLDKVELILALEDNFSLIIEDGDADLIKTVEDAVIYIKKSNRN
jgi:acyl carrier protein